MAYYRWCPRPQRTRVAIEERVEPTRRCSPVTVLGRPGSISEPAEGVTCWLCAEMSNPKKEVAWFFLYCNSTASFPGSCIIGNAAKSKLGGRKLEPGSVKLIYCSAGGRECRANPTFSPSPWAPLHPPLKTLASHTPEALRRLLFA